MFCTYHSALSQPQSPAGRAPRGWCHWSASPRTPSGAPCTTHQPRDLRECPRGTCEPRAQGPAGSSPPCRTNLIHKQRSWRCHHWNKSRWRASWCSWAIELRSSHCWVLSPGKWTITNLITSPKGVSHQQPPTEGRHREEDKHSLTVSSKLRLTPVSSLTQSKEG